MGNVCDNVHECPDCVSTNIICDPEREQVICRDCGLIFEPFVPTASPPEARAAESEQVAKQPIEKKAKPKTRPAPRKPKKRR